MTQLERLTTLVDAVRALPMNRHLERSIFRAERRIEVLQSRRARMTRRLYQFYGFDNRLIRESFKAADRPSHTRTWLEWRVWRYPEAKRPPEIEENMPELLENFQGVMGDVHLVKPFEQ
jgi:hypothetical protein